MQATVKIDMDNAAFADNPEGEIADILSSAAVIIADAYHADRRAEQAALDSNGNQVALIRVTKED